MFLTSTNTILGIVLSIISLINAQTCIHDHIMESIATNVPHDHRQLAITSHQQYNFTVNEHGRALQSTFSPIRIKVDVSRLYDGGDGQFACNTAGAQYIPTLAVKSTDRGTCTGNDVITAEKRAYLIDTLIPAAVAFYTKALSVRPVSGNLRLPNPMPDYSCFNDGSYYYNLVCCDKNFPASLKTTGVTDADYYLFVTARPTAGSVLAWATECQSDQYSRPLCGHANISPARMLMTEKDLPNQISVLVHELGHALGFSSSKYSYFRKPGTLNRVDSLSDVLTTMTDSTLGKTVKKIVTPKVVEFVKNHYNCPNWPNAGGEIEDYGGSGTAGSHWEKRLVMNEIMNPVSEPFMYKSGLFLSYFEDSGWYSVDYSVAEKLPWGFNQGCDFVQKKCVDGWSNFYFCRTPNENGCTADMRYQAQCNLDDNPYVTYPANFQYFPGSPGKGGKQPHTDYCPFYQLFTTRDCSDAGTIAYFFYGEKPGSGSRCLMGTYQLKTVSAAPAMHGGCLQTTCNSLTNLIEITLTGSPPLIVQCPKDGGNLDLSSISGSQYTGYIMCPPSKQLCTGDPCDVQDCNGHGKCNAADGTCTCDVGYSGPNAYSCSWKTCPTRVNTTTCSGHGLCNKLTGICEDGKGNAGCYAGWSESDCGRQGCPQFNGVECAGNGACVNGACQCNAGYIGNDCSLTDCPGSPRCTDPGDKSVGTCDTSLGICSCADGYDSDAHPLYFYGTDCSKNSSGTRPYIPLNFVGELDPATNNTGTYAPVTGRLYAKEYAYFSFNVPTTQFPITLTFTSITGGAVNPAPILTAAYSSFGRPSALNYEFPTTTTEDSGRKVTIQFSSTSAGTSTFSKTGTILVAVVLTGSTGLSYVDYSMELKRDGCATLVCAFGYCSNSRCICDRLPESGNSYVTYGWSGTLCDEPDCPGTPDCGGKRGTCNVPSEAYMSNGTAIRNHYPACTCAGVFSGNDCSSYSASADRVTGAQTSYILDGQWNTRVYTDALSSEYWLKSDAIGATTLNGTYTGTLAIGTSVNKLLIDPDSLALVGWGLNGTLGFYLRLDFSNTPNADGMLLTQAMVPPTFTDYREFDLRSWRAAVKTQEISTTLSQLTFVNIFNGFYGKEIMSYTLYMELSNKCPPSLRGCSGHGTCNLVCECELGWEGIRCDIPVPQIETVTVYETNELRPGDWQYFVFRPSDSPTTQEVTLSLDRTSLSTASWPLLVAAWDSGRYGTSIGKVTSETVFVDYDALIAHNGSQSVTVRRTNTLSQKWLYIGIRNLPTARTSYIGTVTITESPNITMALCSSNDPEDCRVENCHGRGTYTVVRGTPSCECDYGWNKDTACASPIFASFSNLLTAAQNVGFLCSVCTNKASFARDQMSFFKIPQPLQKGTGLSLDVRPVKGTMVAQNRRQLGNVTGVTGHPSLLVSASLPRSILDFVYIESGQSANQTITITEASSTGSYWAAVYANTPGTFLLAAQRAKIPIPPVTTVDNVAALLNWLQHSTAGYVVLGVGGFLMALVVLSCLCQCCCGRTTQLSKIREKFNQLEDDHMKEAEQLERSMIRVASLNPDKLAQTPALAKALERKKSTRMVLEATKSGRDLLNANNKNTNFAPQPTMGAKPVFTVAAPVFQVNNPLQPNIPMNPRIIQSGANPSVAKTSILMQSMNQQQQYQGTHQNAADIHSVSGLRAALHAAAQGGH